MLLNRWVRSTSLFRMARSVWHQSPIIPKRTILCAKTWVNRRNEDMGWYARQLGPWFRTIYPKRLAVFPASEPPYLGGCDSNRVGAIPPRVFRSTHSWQEPEASLFLLRGAQVFSEDGAVFSSNNEVFNEFSHGWSPDLSSKRPYVRPFSSFTFDTRELDGSAAVIAVPGADSHYHWLLQALPRVHLLEDVLDHISYFIVSDQISRSQVESLNLVGIPEQRLLRIGKKQKLFCRELFAPSIPGNEGAVSDWVIQYLRSLAIKCSAADAHQGRGKVYLARGGRRRIVENEQDVRRALIEREYEIFEGHDMSFADQVRFMARQAIIVGAHGAAFSNMVFSRQARILEIFPPDNMAPDCFYPLAQKCGHRYWWTVAEQGAGKDGAVRIDISQLGRALDVIESA